MQPTVPDTPPPPATEIRPLREAEIRAASALVRRVFAEFEAPDYAQEGIDVFHRFIAPEALTEQFRTGALKLWGAFRQDTLAGVAAVRNRSHISLLFVDASCPGRASPAPCSTPYATSAAPIQRFPASPSTRRPMPSKYTANWDSPQPTPNASRTESVLPR